MVLTPEMDYWMQDERSDRKQKHYVDIIRQLDFDLTHRCNMNCRNCNMNANQSNFGHLDFDDYLHVVSCISDPDNILGIKLTGGEPLIHPRFNEFIEHMMSHFKNASIMVHTNGWELPRWEHFNPELFRQLNFRVSEYPGINERKIKKYEDAPNVYIYRWKGRFYDPSIDPNLSDYQAKDVRSRCNFSIRIIGRDLYGCCLSYPVEQRYNLAGIHAPFTTNWQQDWLKIETCKACKHCAMAVKI